MSRGVAVVVLAGGEGSRLGGNKPSRKVGGVPLIDRALAHARGWSDVVAVSVREPAQVGLIDAPILADEPHIAGPFAALVSAFRFAACCGRELVLTVPVDMPFVPPDLCDRLMSGIEDSSCAIANSGGHLHPVCGLWRTSAADHVAAYLSGERRSLRGFAQQIGYREVEWPATPLDPFFNINTADDLAEAELLARR